MKSYKGQLKLKNVINEITYGIYDGLNFHNLTKILNDLIDENVKIIVKINGKNVLNKKGYFSKKESIIGLYDYFIDDFNLEEILWKNVGNNIDIKYGIVI